MGTHPLLVKANIAGAARAQLAVQGNVRRCWGELFGAHYSWTHQCISKRVKAPSDSVLKALLSHK